MGRFLNPDNRAFMSAFNTDIYVDKSGLIRYTNSVLGTKKAFICNSRPRRFGKTTAADMLAAYYSRGCDSSSVFSSLEIGGDPSLRNISTDMTSSASTSRSAYLLREARRRFFHSSRRGLSGSWMSVIPVFSLPALRLSRMCSAESAERPGRLSYS